MNTLIFDIETVPDTALGRRLYRPAGSVRRAGRADHVHQARARKPAANSCRTNSTAWSRSRWSMRSPRCAPVWSLGDEDSPEKELIERFFDGTGPIYARSGVVERSRVRSAGAALPQPPARRHGGALLGDRRRRRELPVQQLPEPVSLAAHGSDGRPLRLPGARAARASTTSPRCSGSRARSACMAPMSGPRTCAAALPRIRAYCETDVLNTYLIYLRFELLRGNLSAAEHALESRRVRSCWRRFRGRAPARVRRRVAARPEMPAASAVESEADVLDLAADGRGIASLDGKAVFIAGALPGERVRFRIRKRRRQLRRGRADRDPRPLRRTASSPRCAHFGVCGGCTLQHLAPAAAARRQAAPVARQSGAHRPRDARERVLEPLGGPAVGLPPARPAGRQIRAQEGPGAGGLSRTGKALPRGHPPLRGPDRAASPTCPRTSPPWSKRCSLREQLPQVEVAAGDARRRAGVPRARDPDARTISSGCEAFGDRAGAADLPADAAVSTRSGRCAGATPLDYAVDGLGREIEFGAVRFRPGQCASINSAMVRGARSNYLQPAAGESGARPVLRHRQFHPAAGAARAARRRSRGRPGAHRSGARQCRPQRHRQCELPHGQSVRAGGLRAVAARTRYDRVLLDPPRAGPAR